MTDPARPFTLAEAERTAIFAALEFTKGDKKAAAIALGCSRSAVYQKLERHGLTANFRKYERARPQEPDAPAAGRSAPTQTTGGTS